MLLPFAVFGTYGGMQSHVYSLSEQIALMGHDVSLIGESIGANKFEIINGVKRIGIKTDPSAYANYFANSYALMNISRHVEKIDRKEKFDVLHAHGAGGALMALKSRSTSNKLIITSHGLPPSYLTKNYSTPNFNFNDGLKKIFAEEIVERIGRYLYNLADHNIAVSKHVANEVHNTYKVKWDRITVIPNGINPEKFFRKPLLKSKLIGTSDPLILFVGRWGASLGKGLHYLVEAFAKVQRNFPNVKLVVVGEYNRESYYAQRIFHLCKKLNIDSSVFFTGLLFPNDVRKYYASSEVFVLSSIYEGLPMTLLEAMASALPVVASEGPHLPTSELIENGVTGLLYDAGNVNQLSDAIIRVLNDKTLAERLGTNAKAHVEKFFNWRVIAEKTLQIYNSA
jgi:glycosyltransferase involved in cell wall biosynthesis